MHCQPFHVARKQGLEEARRTRYTNNMKKKHRILKFILFIIACIGLIHLINRLIAYLADKKGRLTTTSGKIFVWRGDQIYYQVTGAGKPILLIHDLDPVASAYEWNRVIAGLAGNHRVYALDLAGCGRSSKENQTYVAFYQVQMIQAFLKEIVQEPCDIIASHHSAAFIASAAAYDSSYIGKVILINPEAPAELPDSPDLRKKLLINAFKAPIIGTFLYNLRFSRARIESDMTDSGFYNPFNVTDEFVEVCYEGAHKGDGKGRNLYLSQIGGYLFVDPTSALKKLSNDLLVIYGQAFRNKAASIKALSGIRDDLTIEEIPKAGMLPQFEEPESFVDTILTFLDSSDSEAIFAE